MIANNKKQNKDKHRTERYTVCNTQVHTGYGVTQDIVSHNTPMYTQYTIPHVHSSTIPAARVPMMTNGAYATYNLLLSLPVTMDARQCMGMRLITNEYPPHDATMYR